MKKLIIPVCVLILLLLASYSTALTISPTTAFSPSNSNSTYYFNSTTNIDNITVKPYGLNINTNNLTIEGPNTITAYINTYSLPHSLNTTVTTTAGLVNFTMSGFNNSANISVYIDDSPVTNLSADAYGTLNYSYSTWSTHTFLFTENTQCFIKNITVNSTIILVNWTKITASPYYQLQASTTSTFSNIVINITDINTTNYPTYFTERGDYYEFGVNSTYYSGYSTLYFRVRHMEE